MVKNASAFTKPDLSRNEKEMIDKFLSQPGETVLLTCIDVAQEDPQLLLGGVGLELDFDLGDGGLCN